MASTVVAAPVAGATQHTQFPGNPPGSTFPSTRPSSFISGLTDHGPRGHRPFHKPYQFRPRYPMNKGGDDDSGMYDGKRMRKAIHRKTVDYNPSVINYLQNRVWQRDSRDEHVLQPDSLYLTDLVPPSALLDDPLNCVNTKFVRTSTNKFRCPIFCLTWTPEGRRLVTGASSGEFTLWNGLTFNFETILQAHETAVRAMRWSHSDGWMITADHAGYIKYWQSNMNNVKMFQAHKEPIRSISFCPTDSKFASCSDDGTVRVWDFMRCHEERILRGHGADVRCVDWHPQKSLLASGSKDNQQPVKLWDPRTGNSLATLHAHKHTVMDLKWHHNGNWMLTASRDHLLKLFDIRNLKEELQTFKGHKREATAIGWHPIHEGLFASGSADGALMFWMVGCDHEVGGMEMAHEGMIWSLAWHPMGHILASGSNDHATKFWTRNRPGDEMRDRYNLNLLAGAFAAEQDIADAVEAESAIPNLPGMGLEHGVAEHLQVKEEKDENELPSIPGLNWEEDSILLKAEERAANKKVPYARPVPKVFEQAWAGEIDIEQIKKEQEMKQQAKQAPPPTFNQPTLLLAQQMLGAALTGALRQQLAGLPGGHMLLRPGGQLMLGQAMMGALRPQGAGPAGPMLLLPGGPGVGPRLPGPAGGQQQQQGPNTSGPPGGPSNEIKSDSATEQSTGEASSSENQNQNGQSDTGSAQQPDSVASDSVQKDGPDQNRPQASVADPSQVPAPAGGPQSNMQSQIRGPIPGQMRGPPPILGQMGGPPQNQNGGQSHMGGPPQGHIHGPPPSQTQMGGLSQGQMRGPHPSTVGGPPHSQMVGPPQGTIGGPPQGQMGAPPQGQMGGPPQGQMGGPSQGQMGGPPQGQLGGAPQGQVGGTFQGQISGPPQGHIGGPPQGQMGGPPPGQMGGPLQGHMRSPRPPQSRMGGPPQGHMGGPPQGPRGGPRGPPQSQMGRPPQPQMRMRHPGPPGQQPGPRPQRPPFQGQGPPVDQRGGMQGGEQEEMDTDERYNVHGPGQDAQEPADMDKDYRAPHAYNRPARPFSGEDQDLRQQGPPPPHHRQMFKPGPPRQPQAQADHYGDYGDTDERVGDTGDYDYRMEAAPRRGRGRAPFRAGYSNRGGGYSNYDSSNSSADYDNSGNKGGDWGYEEQGEGYKEGYHEDYNDGYGEESGYEESGERHGPPQPISRKRAWEEGQGPPDRGRGQARGWGRGGVGDGWGRGTRGGFRGPRGGGPGGPGMRGGFRGRGGPWQRGGPGGDRGGIRGRGAPRGAY